MPHSAAKLSPPPRRRSASLFGAIGPQAVSVARENDSQRERAQEEASRVSGTFYVDRMIGSVRLR
jgi:hypothetical protein